MKTLRLATAGAVAVVTLSMLSVGIVSADQMSLIPLEITPVCAQADTNLAYWNVTNKNDVDVHIDWTALDNGHTGTYEAPAGHGQFASYYDPADPNNTTQFKSETDTNQTNSSNTPCQPGDIDNGGSTTPPLTPPADGGSGGGSNTGEVTTPVTTTPTNANTTAPELADTGASRVLPYAAAAVIALFTAATSILVRKNVL